MSRIPVLTDELLRRALAPDDELLAPADLLEAIADDVRRTRQRTGVSGWWTRVATAPRDRLAWGLVAGAAILALLAGLLLAGGGPKPRAELVVGEMDFARVLGVGREEAWVASFGGQLWHRTNTGWTGPEPTGIDGIRGLARLPDGRIVVSGDSGVRLRDDLDRWTELSDMASGAPTVDAGGAIWVAADRGLDLYRLEGGRWHRSHIPCQAGGQLVAQASDGSVWTGGIGFAGALGLARWDGSSCDAVFPMTEGESPEVISLAAGPDATIAIVVAEGVGVFSGRTLLWDGSTWTTIRDDVASPPSLAFDSRGELFGGIQGDRDTGDAGGIWRYRGGAWTQVIEGAIVTPWNLSVTPDDTLWYEAKQPDGSGTIERIPVGDLPR